MGSFRAGALFGAWVLVACGGPTAERGDDARRAAVASRSVAWQPWARASFERAQRERKLVLVSVQAGWCHWCHVMNATTYRDPRVLERLSRHVVAIRVEADARPDLAERYARWGWPATIVLTPDAQPITELRGHREAAELITLVDELAGELRAGRPIAHRAPPPRHDPTAIDLAAARDRARAQLDGLYDLAQDGWGGPKKYPLAAPVEHAVLRADLFGDEAWGARAVSSLARYTTLIDPVWGGVYQYSIHGVWTEPHYEKIVPVQAGMIERLVEMDARDGSEGHRRDADRVVTYLLERLRAPSGAFHTSQDADASARDGARVDGHDFYARDERGRAALVAPHVDTNVYASTNGMVIAALATHARRTGDRATLSAATRAAEVLAETHADRGAFAHDAAARGGVLHLADQVEMARAFFALHQATGDARWLERTRALVATTITLFEDESGGFFAHTADPDAVGVFAERRKPLEDNGKLARLLLRLSWLDAEGGHRARAERALRAVSEPAVVAESGRAIGEYLLALEELSTPHVILSVVGAVDDPATDEAYRAARVFFFPTAVVELGRPGASRYPYPGAPAVYFCTEDACSLPAERPEEVAPRARAFIAETLATSGDST